MRHAFSNIEPFEIAPGFTARITHTENNTIALVTVEAGAVLPEHAHFHEQTTTVLEGEFEINTAGQNYSMHAGDFIHLPSNQPHGGRALTKCLLLDVFYPVREDFRNRKVDY